MCAKRDKERYYRMVESVRRKRDTLPANSPIRMLLNDEFLQGVINRIEQTEATNLFYAYWPPVLGLIYYHSVEAINRLNSDLEVVLDASDQNKRADVLQFLNARSGKDFGVWYGKLFDLWAKATALKSSNPVELDCSLPNGRDHDMTLTLNGRKFHLENTVLTKDDEARAVWNRFVEDKRNDPTKMLVRPGAYCPEEAKGPSPYYDARRFYAKIYDKIAKNLNPDEAQFPDGEPNVLLVSFPEIELRADSPSNGWVLDELFADQPNGRHIPAPDETSDVSLSAWIDFTAHELIKHKQMSREFYCENFSRIIAAPRLLGGILLFNGTSLVASRVNYNANTGCKISHREMSDLEAIFKNNAPYWQ